MTGAASLDRPKAAIVRRAAEWAALLDDDRATAEQHAACEAWCDEHADHRLAFDRMRVFDRQFDDLPVPERRALAAVASRRPRRRSVVAGLAGFCLIVGAGWLATQSFALRGYFPDHRTATGEQRSVTLADGSRLTIDSASALDIRAGRDERRIDLFRGRVMARVAPAPGRPFVVVTRDGSATALGTLFSVRRDDAGTVVTVIESVVRACPASAVDDSLCLRLTAGEQARITPASVKRLERVDVGAEAAWTKGWLEANDRPLADVLAEINRYRRVPIRYDASALAGIRVTGSYPLLDAERTLEAIAATGGIRVSRAADGTVLLSPHR